MKYSTSVYPMKSLEEMQRDAKIRNDAEAEKLCKICFIIFSWLMCFSIFLWCISIIITSGVFFKDKDINKNQINIIENYLIGSGSV